MCRWEQGPWTQCSVTCGGGGGWQDRSVQCVEEDTHGQFSQVEDWKCTHSPRPVTRQICNTFACPQWVAMEWSQVSVRGFAGLQKNVFCLSCYSKLLNNNLSTTWINICVLPSYHSVQWHVVVVCGTAWFCASTIKGSTSEAVKHHSNLTLRKTVLSLWPATSPGVPHTVSHTSDTVSATNTVIIGREAFIISNIYMTQHVSCFLYKFWNKRNRLNK